MSNKTAAEKKSIFAITNLDAEDLGSSILETYSTKEQAIEQMELIETGIHSEYFQNLSLDVFEIGLPKEVYTTEEVAVLITKVLKLAAEKTHTSVSLADIKLFILNTDFKHLLK